MISAPLPPTESGRLAALIALQLLDTPREERFDRITRLAARLMNMPIALISLVDKERQWFKSAVGLDVPQGTRTASFCAHAILDDQVFVVPDAKEDLRFVDNPLVIGGPEIRFYAGAPLTATGHRVGTLCVIDNQPRALTADQLAVLTNLAELAESEINAVKVHEVLAKVAESERWVRAITDAVPALVAYVDQEQRFHFANEEHRSWFQIGPDSLLGTTLLELLGPASYAQWAPYLRAALAGTKQHFEQSITTPGQCRYGDIRLTPHMGAQGQVHGTFIHVTDLSERRQAEEALAHSEELFRRLAEVAPVGIFQTDAAGQFTFVNERWCQLAGLSPQQALGEGWRTAVHGEDHQQSFEGWEQAIASGDEYGGEYRFLQAGGRVVWISARALPLGGGEDGGNRWVGICSDITVLAEAHQQTERARAAAEQASQAKARFLANMSHEIRTPLSGVLGVIRILLEKDLPPVERNLAETVDRNARQLMNIVNDVLDFSKVDGGHMELDQRSFEPRVILEDLSALHSARASTKGLVLSTKAAAAVPRVVLGDDNRLHQVLNNLVGNALKFTERGTISVEAEVVERSGTQVVLRFAVRDEGIGIALEAQARIFEEFSQADSSTARKFGGTGLGLAISNRLVKLMGGTLGVDSQPGRGATFFFTIPFECSPANQSAGEAPVPVDAAPVVPPGMRVLVAEDSETNRFVAIHLLEKLGCVVDAVSNGLEALEAVAAHRFDLILMDCQMPEMDGYTASRTLRERGFTEEALPIIALTAHAFPGERERCLEAGMNAYLGKPLDIKLLAVRLAAIGTRAPQPQPAVRPPVFSPEALKSLAEDYDHDAKMLQYMAGLFTREAAQVVDTLQAALSGDDCRALVGPAHKLRGIAANFRALRLQELSAGLEEASRQGPVRDASARVSEIVLELQHVIEALKTFQGAS